LLRPNFHSQAAHRLFTPLTTSPPYFLADAATLELPYIDGRIPDFPDCFLYPKAQPRLLLRSSGHLKRRRVVVSLGEATSSEEAIYLRSAGTIVEERLVDTTIYSPETLTGDGRGFI